MPQPFSSSGVAPSPAPTDQEHQPATQTGPVPAPAIPHSFWGVLLIMAATLFLASMDAITKYLTLRYNVPLVMGMRYLVHCLLMYAVLTPIQGKALIQTHHTGLVIIRSLCLVVTSLFFGMALQRMPVAESTALIFLAPIVVVLLAGLLLKERIGLWGWIAVLLGFAGVLLIAHPGSALNPAGIVCALLAVAANVAYQLLSRILAGTERTLPLLFNSALVGAVFFGLLFPWSWHGPSPEPVHILFFLIIGMAGGMGHFLFTAAYRFATASQLAPANYLQLVWASLLGWLVFHHVPDLISLVGMLIVILSGIIIALRARLSPQPYTPALLTATRPSLNLFALLRRHRTRED